MKTSKVLFRDSAIASRAGALFVGLIAAVASLPSPAAVDVSQVPLYVGANVPGNLAIVPSVEFPTVISVANLDATYSSARKYTGYFDALKCYRYVYAVSEPDRRFEPVGPSAGYACGANLWSGNFMNWAATQTIDPFRSALTGGYRVVDNTSETVLEKAIADRDSTGNFPRRSVTNAALVSDATPAEWGSLKMRIDGLVNKMWFTANGGGNVDTGASRVAYDPSIHNLNVANITVGGAPIAGDKAVYEVSVRVKVCDASAGLEPNCVVYPNGKAKPEGLIQQYSNKILYSIFGYQNTDGYALDGGILRAKQKFVGPQSFYPEAGPQTNLAAEWDPNTGVLFTNPDAADAADTSARVAAGGGSCSVTGGCTIRNSGVINYLNKFGQMGTGKVIKSQDNVSELYYTAVRYFKSIGNVPQYTALPGNVTTNYQRADAFPVITNWNDPIRYQCQTNVILGIGDTNTWMDKNLPSATATSTAQEPTPKPPLVVADTTVDVVDMLRKIWVMEGKADAVARSTAAYFNTSAHNNSAYIAALAYDSHTRDIRPDGKPNAMLGTQTISTHWVDVIEGGTASNYKQPDTNQYYLAGKYGGFSVPVGFDPDTQVAPLPDSMWWTSGDMVGSPTFKRPDNFYAAAQADKMVESLTKAFKRISLEMVGSGGSFASNTTKLDTGAMTYQAQFYSGSWRGDITGYTVNPTTGALSYAWNAGAKFPAWATRKIRFSNSGTLANFVPGAAGLSLTDANVINYLRGDRSKEIDQGGTLRNRTGLLGDIVNSQPVYVGSPNPRLYLGASFNGASLYPAYAAARAARTPAIYVGANDGMLHGFDASAAGGAETFAFMPTAVMSSITDYTQAGYAHRYYVDGELTVADVFDTSANAWKTVLVGTLGRGGRGVFALDVTDPANVKLLWEKTEAQIAQLGYNIGKPIIAQVANGDWRVLMGNGPNSTGSAAQLVTIGVVNGVASATAPLAAGDNGLSGVLGWASAAGGFTDTAYAGDLKGNMWKITGLAASPTAFNLFTAQAGGKVQPITASPLVAKNPNTADTWVFFGTGKYLGALDIPNKDPQTWYGLIDKGTAISSSRSTLSEISILAEGTIGGFEVRAIEDNVSPGADGWYMDLVSPGGLERGERMVVPNLFQGLALIGTTRIPDSSNVCSPSGTGYVMAINPFTGGRLPQSFFDANGDGSFDNGDNLGGLPISGIGLPSSPNAPIFIGDVMQISLDNGGNKTVKTNSTAMSAKRVSWREILRD